ncbi:MAG TPA: hypothetical protein VLW55_05845 [Burkholderiaceae bacterium]|nr:hypothetical protein [Burkholderiaceae bacterium]
MPSQLKRLAAAAGLATACLAGLSGCGGGGGGSASTDDGLTQIEREDLAASSWPGMLLFAEGQISTMTNETAQPRPIAGIKPPQSETGEPAAI